MGSPQRYRDEVRGRAVRFVRDLVEDCDGALTVTRACRLVGEQLSITAGTLRRRVAQTRDDAGEEPWFTSGELAGIAAIEREVGQLRRADAIVKTASALLATELDGPRPR